METNSYGLHLATDHLPATPNHVIQRGSNRQAIFAGQYQKTLQELLFGERQKKIWWVFTLCVHGQPLSSAAYATHRRFASDDAGCWAALCAPLQ
jgi:hypothetical protein